MKLSVFFVNENGDYGESTPINVFYSDTKIRFGWLVPKEATAIKGKLKLEIQARGASPLGGNYVLKTQPNDEINILESLQGNGSIIVDEDWATSVLEDVKKASDDALAASAISKSYAEQAKTLNTNTITTVNNALTEIEEKIENSATTISDEIKTEMASTYYTQEQTEGFVSERLGKIKNNSGDDITVEAYIEQEIANADIDGKLTEYALKADIPTNVSQLTNDVGYLTEHQSLDEYATKQFVTDQIAEADISDKLQDYVTITALNEEIGNLVNGDGNKLTVEQYVKQEVEAVDVSDQLANYYEKEETYNRDEIDTKIANVEVDLTGYATETYVGQQIAPLSTAITSINQSLEGIDKSPNAYYITTYNEPYVFEGTEYTGENTLVLYEIYNKDKENETRTVVASHVIQGGSGSGTSNIIKIERITGSPFVVTSNDKVIIEYNFIGTDSSGEDISQGNATWKLGNQVIKTEKIYTGENSADITEFISTGSDQKVTLIITDDIGTISQKSWYVSVVDVKLESTFNDTRHYTVNTPVDFTYTPYGAVDKTVKQSLDAC